MIVRAVDAMHTNMSTQLKFILSMLYSLHNMLIIYLFKDLKITFRQYIQEIFWGVGKGKFK